MSANRAPPNFGRVNYFANDAHSPGYGCLRFLTQATTLDATRIPFCWGFTIYRATKAVAGQDPEADARFAEGLRRFEAIVRWDFLQTKKALGIVVAGLDVPNGTEDFSPVGRAFIASVAAYGKPNVTGPRIYAKFQLLQNTKRLILDDKSLDTLLTLPKEPPLTAPEDELDAFNIGGGCRVWLWVLDRETMQACEDGKPLLKLPY